MNKTGISWTGKTWNCIRGCDKISSGCKNCYAEVFAERFRGVKGNAYEQGFDLRLVPGKLAEPFGLKKPDLVFVNSMSDFFHDRVPDAFQAQMAWVMLKADWHIYQVLTKRADRLKQALTGKLLRAAKAKHIFWGVSVEDRKHGVPRIDYLRESGAAVKWLSVEPLLEDLGEINLTGIDWVVVGGESGHGARPMEREWVISLRDQCRAANVPFFFKQWGGVRKNETGELLDGELCQEFPRAVTNPVRDEGFIESAIATVRSWEAVSLLN